MKSLTIPSVRTDFDYIVITGAIIYSKNWTLNPPLANEDVLPQWLLQLVVNEKNKEAQWQRYCSSLSFSKFRTTWKNNNGLWFVPKGE